MPAESKRKKVCTKCQQEYAADSELAICPRDNTPLFLLSAADLVGSQIAESYKVETFTGADGYLMLYAVRHQHAGERFLMKVLPILLCTEERIARFKFQAQNLSKVTHKGLVRLFDYGCLPDGRAYIIAENPEGKTLSQTLHDGVVSPSRALELMLQACDALVAIHSAGLVHACLKPSSVVISKDASGNELVKLADVGITHFLSFDKTSNADQLGRGTRNAGMLPYASPEQGADRPVDSRSDIYSLGCVFYHALTGRPPYEAQTEGDLAAKHGSAIMPLPFNAVRRDLRLPLALEDITFKALAKDPADRYQNALQLKSSLERARASVEAPRVVSAFHNLLAKRKEGLRRERVLGRVGKIAVIGTVLALLLLLLQHFASMFPSW